MAEPICEDEGLLQEWSPLAHLVQQIPLKIQKGLFWQNLNLTCLDVVPEFVALGTNLSLVYWYSRASGELQRLRLEKSNSAITCVKVVSTVDYMVAAGTNQGTVTVFQIPKIVPDSIPHRLKPKKKQIERFTIDGLHNAPITNIEWSQNGMKVFSGDKNGVVVLTEIDFAMHLSKSVELLNEQFEIIQLSYNQQILLISTVYRSIICDGTNNWKVHQIGTKERKTLGKFGATFCKFDHSVVLYACRPGSRLWLADKLGVVQQTLIFKSAVQSSCPKIQLINPVNKKEPYDTNFGKVLQFGDNKLITYNSEVLYVLHPKSVSVMSVLCNARKILDLAINENEIFILEGERSLLRISPLPDKYSLEVLYHPISLKPSFNLDGIAAKLKDTAVGSIKKITKDLMPEQNWSSTSPPVLADEAIELPPIVNLPDGLMPSIFLETNDPHSLSQQNNQSTVSHNYQNSNVSEKDPGVRNHFSTPYVSYDQDCQEVISRPLRKKKNKKPKVVESESDTTSSASEDRLVWGVTNDMSLSEESAACQSHSSFSVLHDIPLLLNQYKAVMKNKEMANEGNNKPFDANSQTSVDTCESVSERMHMTPEKFREEQEKIFACLANQSLLDSFNSEKTDNISMNMTTSSSFSSKISGNLPTPSDYSDNSSITSGAKTGESQISLGFQNSKHRAHVERSYGESDGNYQHNNLSSQDERETSSQGSLVQSQTSRSERLYGRWTKNEEGLRTPSSEILTDISEYPSPYVSDRLEDKFQELCCSSARMNADEPFPSEYKKEILSLDFGTNKFSNYWSHDLFNQTSSPAKCRQAGQFFNSGNNSNDSDDDKELEKNESKFPDTEYSTREPLTYGPPSGSSLLSLQHSFDTTSMQNSHQAPKPPARELFDLWAQYVTPEPIISLAVSKNYALYVDINDQVYYSDLAGLSLNWILLDYKASSVRVSYDGSVVWLLNKKSIFSLVDCAEKGPISSAIEKVANNVKSFDIDKKTKDGWIVTTGGKIIRHRHKSNNTCEKIEHVPCEYIITDIICSGDIVMAVTENDVLLCRPPKESKFKIVKTYKRRIFFVAFGPEDLLWIVDDKNNVYFSDDYLNDNPRWWQVQISDYIFQNPSSTLQSFYNKIKINNLKSNMQVKITFVSANENSVWIYDKFSTTIRLNKSDFTGYIWNEVSSVKSLPNIQWQSLSGEGVFEDKGHIWLLSTDGNIFCTSPKSNDFQTIPVPCEDNVLCLASSSDTLWILSESGKVFSRLGLTCGNLSGNSWRELKLPQIDNLRLIWVSCGCDVAWGCDVHGRTFITIGSPHHMATNIFDAAWLEVEGRPKGVQFEKVFVGPQLYMVWAIDVKGNLYVREGIFSHYQIGTSWVYVGGIEAVHISISGTSVWALASSGSIYRRCGISESNYIGDYWKSIPGTFKRLTTSFTDNLWGITHEDKLLKLMSNTKVLNAESVNQKDKETHSSKEDVSWEIVE